MSRGNRVAVFSVAALLVWSAAFGGGYTVALFTANTDVSGTFETVESFSVTADSSADSTVDVALDGPERASTENGSTGDNATATEPLGAPSNASRSGGIGNDTAVSKSADNGTTETKAMDDRTAEADPTDAVDGASNAETDEAESKDEVSAEPAADTVSSDSDDGPDDGSDDRSDGGSADEDESEADADEEVGSGV